MSDHIELTYCTTCKREHYFGFDEIGAQLEMLSCAQGRRIRDSNWLFHPGEYLEDELQSRGWTTRDIAIRASDDQQERAIIECACDMLISCSYADLDHAGASATIGESLATNIAAALGTSADVWLLLDAEYHKRRCDRTIERG